MTLELSTLWDFSEPEISEQRFRDALESATDDEKLILQTQIARSFGIRKDFTRAQEILAAIEPQVQNACGEVRVHYSLELGRTYSSTTHSSESQTEDAMEKARTSYMQAFEIARVENLDDLAIDALHMMAMVDTTPSDQLKWGEKALTVLESSSQQAAKKWEGSLRNNIGYALNELGRYEEALSQFKLALEIRERAGNRLGIRIAHWMIARTLRLLGRTDEALAIQLQMESEWEAAGKPSPFVFEELEILYRSKNNDALADKYAERRKQLS